MGIKLYRKPTVNLIKLKFKKRANRFDAIYKFDLRA